MTYKTIISNQPSCKTCGKLMKEWNPFAEEHEHPVCAAERMSEHLIQIIREQMSNANSNKA